MAALGLSGCASDPAPPAASAPSPPAVSASPSQPSDLPQPSALIDVLNRLSDPAIPGADKLGLVEGATPDEAATLDAFTTALGDNHMAPLTYMAGELAWSQRRPGYLVANVVATAPDPAVGPFSFPMEFKPPGTAGDGWQLSRQTADQLFAVGER